MGKWAILRRHFLLIVLTFCIYLNQNVVKFQEQRPLASTSVQIQNANFPCAYVLMTNRNVLPDAIAFLSCTVRPGWRFNLSVYFLCVCVSICCVYFPALCGGKELDHILYSAECSCICFKYLLSGMKLALIPEAVTKPMFFLRGGEGLFIWNGCMWSKRFEEVLKKQCSVVIVISLSWICLKLHGTDLPSTPRYLQTPGRARFVLCNLVLSDDFIHKYMV